MSLSRDMRKFNDSLAISFLLVAVFLLAQPLLAKDSKEAPPMPDKDPAVLAAKEAFNEKKKKTAAARAEVARRRTELSRYHARSRLSVTRAKRTSSVYQASAVKVKSDEEMKKAEANLSEVLEKLHASYQNKNAINLKKEITKAKEALEDERLENKPNGKRIAELSSRVNSLSRKLKKLEATIFKEDDDYKAAMASISSSRTQRLRVMAHPGMDRAAYTFDQPDQTVISIKGSIQEAIDASTKAFKQEKAAKRELQKKINAAAVKYHEWRQAKLEEEKKKKQKKK